MRPGPMLVIQTAFLGDVVLTTPLLSRLAARFGPVDVVTTPAAAELLETHPAVRQVIRYDKRGTDSGLGGFRRLAERLAATRYAGVFLPHRSWRSAALAACAHIPDRIGFDDSPAAMLYTERVPRPRGGHESARLLALADGGRHEGAVPAVGLTLTDADRAAADAWLKERKIAGPFVAVAPGSIWGTKRWPGYAELVARLKQPVVVLGSAADSALADEVAAAGAGRAHSAAGALSLRESAAVIARANLLVTNDSAPLHLATGVGTPVVAVFGPTTPAQGFGPIGAGSRVVEEKGLWCRPCSPHGPATCPLGHHTCMQAIGVERVLAAVASASAAGAH
ncbi:MAG: lipopolysaccharide heptosyltransferase II [Gemmatimonadales bacterium]